MDYLTKFMVLPLLLLVFFLDIASQSSTRAEVAALERANIGELLIPRYGLSAATDGQWIYVYGVLS